MSMRIDLRENQRMSMRIDLRENQRKKYESYLAYKKASVVNTSIGSFRLRDLSEALVRTVTGGSKIHLLSATAGKHNGTTAPQHNGTSTAQWSYRITAPSKKAPSTIASQTHASQMHHSPEHGGLTHTRDHLSIRGVQILPRSVLPACTH